MDNTSKQEQINTIISKLNESVREYENSHNLDQIRYSLAGWAEYAATNLFDTTVEAIDPKLSELLHRIKAQRGQLAGDDAFDLIDYRARVEKAKREKQNIKEVSKLRAKARREKMPEWIWGESK